MDYTINFWERENTFRQSNEMHKSTIRSVTNAMFWLATLLTFYDSVVDSE